MTTNNKTNAANNAANKELTFGYWKDGKDIAVKAIRVAAVATQFSEGKQQIAVTTEKPFITMNADGDFVEGNTLWFYPSILFDALEKSIRDEDTQYVLSRVRALSNAEKRNERLRLFLIGARFYVTRQTHAVGEVSDRGHAYQQDCFSTRIKEVILSDTGRRVIKQTLAAIDAADMQTFSMI